MRSRLSFALLALPYLVTSTAAVTPEAAQNELAARVEKLTAAEAAGVRGADGWYFATAELRAYSAGKFWGDAAATASRAPKDKDPLPTIVAFNDMLKQVGVPLIVVPVPGKVVLYPDKLDPPLHVDSRLDGTHVAFFDELRKAGVTVIDVEPDFRTLRTSGVDPFCKQDPHWSPRGLEAAAKRMADLVKGQAWYVGVAKHKATTTEQPVEVRGDIVAALLRDGGQPPERLTLQQVKLDGDWVDSDAASPVVLMGDSHTLVFHRPDLLGEHAGLSDQLAALLGFPVDLVGVMGGGANASRVALARRRDNLAGKKVVLWVFRASEFSETDEGWRPIPVIR